MEQREAEEPLNMKELQKYEQSTSHLQHLSGKPHAQGNTLSWVDWHHNTAGPTLAIFAAFSADQI